MSSTSPAKHRFWEAAATIWSAAVIGLAVSPLRNVNLLTAPISDKLLHGIAFMLGTIVWAGTLETGAGKARSVGLAALVCLALGGIIEVLQTQTPTRSAESGDLLADAAGILVGAAIWGLVRGRRSSSPAVASVH
ncbi:VanZ family protein [bacterium]|nr:VanZ family protein [bacterium]